MSHVGFRYRPVLTALVLLGCAATQAVAQQAPQQRRHEVRRGDTLWDLSSTYLGNPFLWPMIFEANRDVVEDPHWIYPREVLVIPPITPVSARPAGDPLGAAYDPLAAEPVTLAVAEEEAAVLNTVDLRRPLIAEAEYRATPWVSPATAPLVRGRLVRLGDPSEAQDRIPAMLHPNYRVHVGELRGAAMQPGWGQVVEPLAILHVDELSGSTFSARVVRQMGEARIGDRVIALDAFPAIPRGERTAVAGGPQGTLLRFLEEQPLYGTGDHAFISLGEGQVGLGDEVAIYVQLRRADALSAERIPPTEIARAAVVRLAGRTATVRLTRVTDTSLTDGLPVLLVGRAP